MDAPRGSAEPLLSLAEIASRSDFALGDAIISPSSRVISGPGGSADIEPRVLQVLVALAEHAGEVVTRESLFERCWGDIHVGDDSLNRTIGSIRKLAGDIGHGTFRIETLPRAGYRLVVGGQLTPPVNLEKRRRSSISRRAVIGGGAAVVALAGGVGIWRNRLRSDPQFDLLMRQGESALRLDDPRAAGYFERATKVEPRNARAWGLLAYALGSGQNGGPNTVAGPTALAGEQAARTSLEIDPTEPNALLAMTFFRGGMADWLSREGEYRRILKIDPVNVLAMRQLGMMLHGVGRCSEALAIAERALSIEPLTPDLQMRKALRLWALGRVAEADPVIDRAMVLWPAHPFVRLGRLMVYAFTNRAKAALAMVEAEERKPIFLTPAASAIWRVSLAALDDPNPNAVAAARKANVEASRTTPQIPATAVLTLSALGEIGPAFEVANGFLLSRGSVILRQSGPDELKRSPVGWRNTFGLFTPPTRAMRLDPRFHTLAEGLGLTDYWRRRGIGPDAFLFAP